MWSAEGDIVGPKKGKSPTNHGVEVGTLSHTDASHNVRF